MGLWSLSSMPVRFFSFFAHRKPHALHSVLGPFGPLRHSGESSVPQSAHTYSSATLSFFLSFFAAVAFAISVQKDGNSRVTSNERGRCVSCGNAVTSLAVAVSQTGEQLDGFEMCGGRLVAGHFIRDTFRFLPTKGFAEVLAGKSCI